LAAAARPPLAARVARLAGYWFVCVDGDSDPEFGPGAIAFALGNPAAGLVHRDRIAGALPGPLLASSRACPGGGRDLVLGRAVRVATRAPVAQRWPVASRGAGGGGAIGLLLIRCACRRAGRRCWCSRPARRPIRSAALQAGGGPARRAGRGIRRLRSKHRVCDQALVGDGSGGPGPVALWWCNCAALPFKIPMGPGQRLLCAGRPAPRRCWADPRIPGPCCGLAAAACLLRALVQRRRLSWRCRTVAWSQDALPVNTSHRTMAAAELRRAPLGPPVGSVGRPSAWPAESQVTVALRPLRRQRRWAWPALACRE